MSQAAASGLCTLVCPKNISWTLRWFVLFWRGLPSFLSFCLASFLTCFGFMFFPFSLSLSAQPHFLWLSTYWLLCNTSLLLLLSGCGSYCFFNVCFFFFPLFCYFQPSQEFPKSGWYQSIASVALFGALLEPYVLEKLREVGIAPHVLPVCAPSSGLSAPISFAWVSSGCVHISTSCAQSGVPSDSSSLLPLCCQMFRRTPDRFIKQGIFSTIHSYRRSAKCIFSGTSA